MTALNGAASYGLLRRLVPGMVSRGRGMVAAVSSQGVKVPYYLVPYTAGGHHGCQRPWYPAL
jgi:hypothetical protein